MLLRVTTWYYLSLRVTTRYYVILRVTTCYYVLLRVTACYYVLLRVTTCYLLHDTTHYCIILHAATRDYISKCDNCVILNQLKYNTSSWQRVNLQSIIMLIILEVDPSLLVAVHMYSPLYCAWIFGINSVSPWNKISKYVNWFDIKTSSSNEYLTSDSFHCLFHYILV